MQKLTEIFPSFYWHQSKKKESVVNSIQYALDSGLKMMEKYYDKVTYDLSDSDDEDGCHKKYVLINEINQIK